MMVPYDRNRGMVGYRPPYNNPYRRYVNPASVVAGVTSAFKLGRKVRDSLSKSRSRAVQGDAKQVSNPSQTAKGVNKRLKKKRLPKGKFRRLERRVKEVASKINNDNGTLTHKIRNVDRVISSSINEAAYVSSTGSSAAFINSTVLPELRYYNYAAPTGTYVQADFAAGTGQKEVRMTIYTKLVARNNYVVPCELDIYLCTPKEDTSLTVATAITNGFTDIGNPSAVSNLLYPTESPGFNQLWAIKKHKKCMLAPGAQYSMNSGNMFSWFNVDPTEFDAHSLTYQKHWGSHQYLTRVGGVLTHDISADQQGFDKAGVDICIDSIHKVIYPAGANLKWTVVTDNSASFSTGHMTLPDSDQAVFAL